MKKLMSLILVGLFVMVFSTNVVSDSGQSFLEPGGNGFIDDPDYPIKAANRGDYDAMIRVGKAHLGNREFTVARQWFKEAADRNPDALIWVAVSYQEEARILGDRNPESAFLLNKALKMFEEAAANKNKEANYRLGVWYYQRGNTDKAVEYWIKSARDDGNQEAMRSLSSIEKPSKAVKDYLDISKIKDPKKEVEASILARYSR